MTESRKKLTAMALIATMLLASLGADAEMVAEAMADEEVYPTEMSEVYESPQVFETEWPAETIFVESYEAIPETPSETIPEEEETQPGIIASEAVIIGEEDPDEEAEETIPEELPEGETQAGGQPDLPVIPDPIIEPLPGEGVLPEDDTGTIIEQPEQEWEEAVPEIDPEYGILPDETYEEPEPVIAAENPAWSEFRIVSDEGTSAGPGEMFTASLILGVSNADETPLIPFTIVVDLNGLAGYHVLAVQGNPAAMNVELENNNLMVTVYDAMAMNGEVLAGGIGMTVLLQLQPFADTTVQNAGIRYNVYDFNGQVMNSWTNGRVSDQITFTNTEYTENETIIEADQNEETEETEVVTEQPEEIEPETEDEQPEEAETETEDEQPEETEPETEDEQPEEAEPETEDEQPEETEPETEDEQPEEAEPETEDEQPEETESETEDEQPEETETETEGEQPEEAETETEDEQPEEAETETEDEQPEETEPETEDEQPEETEPETEAEQPEVIAPSATMVTNIDGIPVPGDLLEMTAVVTGLDDVAWRIQWQYLPKDGTDWIDMGSTQDLTITHLVTEEDVGTSWRFVIFYNEETPDE